MKEVEKIIGYEFSNKDLLKQAFTRESYAKEQRVKGKEVYGNEQLEFYGDSVLNYIVISDTFNNFCVVDKELKVKEKEDKLTNFVSHWTNKTMLSSRIDDLDLAKYLILSKGDLVTNANTKDSVKEDLFEAIVGAMWIDSNKDISKIESVVLKMLNLTYDSNSTKKNEYSELLELKDKKIITLVEQELETNDGFVITMDIQGDTYHVFAEAVGNSIKSAKKEAAIKALKEIRRHRNTSIEIPKFDLANSINVLQELSQKDIIGEVTYDDRIKLTKTDDYWEVECSIKEFSNTFIGTSKLKKEAKKEAAYQALSFILRNINNDSYNPLNKKELYIFNSEEETIDLYVVNKIESFFYKGNIFPSGEYLEMMTAGNYPWVFESIKEVVMELFKSYFNNETEPNDYVVFNNNLEKELNKLTDKTSLEKIEYLVNYTKNYKLK